MTREEAKEIFLNRGYVKVKGGVIFDGDLWRQSSVVISEWLNEQGPFINKPCVSSGVCEHDKQKVLDKIRAELHVTAEMHEDGDYYIRDEWIDEYFDKYKAEKE